MKYKSFLFIALLFVWAFPASNCYAQTENSLPPASRTPIQHLEQDNSADTALNKTYLKENPDILKWKKNRQFFYMHFLDSLLRKEKDMRTDTVSVDEKSGRIKRRPLKSEAPSAVNHVLNSWPLKLFFWSLALLFIAFISYKALFKNGIFKRKKNLQNEEAEVSPRELSELSEYDLLAQEAENKNEFNLATRYLFLKTLKYLSDKGLILYTNEKTNSSYINEMREHNYSDEFRKLTRDYEYVWYGKFRIGKEEYEKLKEDFLLFNKKV